LPRGQSDETNSTRRVIDVSVLIILIYMFFPCSISSHRRDGRRRSASRGCGGCRICRPIGISHFCEGHRVPREWARRFVGRTPPGRGPESASPHSSTRRPAPVAGAGQVTIDRVMLRSFACDKYVRNMRNMRSMGQAGCPSSRSVRPARATSSSIARSGDARLIEIEARDHNQRHEGNAVALKAQGSHPGRDVRVVGSHADHGGVVIASWDRPR
jgi:hypothetical protein